MTEVLADATPAPARDVAGAPATPSAMTSRSAVVQEAAAQATRSISPHPPTTAPTVAPLPVSLSSSSSARSRARTRIMAATATTTPTQAATKAAAYTAPKALPRGPPRPSVNRLLAICGKDEDEVKSALGLDELAWHNVVWNRVPAIERWAPVLAKCTLLSRRGLVQLLTKQSPNGPSPTVGEKLTTPTAPNSSDDGAQPSSQQCRRRNRNSRHRRDSDSSPSDGDGDNGTESEHGAASADTPETADTSHEAEAEAENQAADTDERTVGRTVYESLRQRGDSCVALCREALTKGWVGWERWRLTEAQVDAFFAGVCDEAEQVADFLLKLGQATDPTNLYSLFVV